MSDCLTISARTSGVSALLPDSIGSRALWYEAEKPDGQHEDSTLENQQALNRFLASVEKRAFRMAEFATGNREHALDIVQDAMMSLVRRYSHKPESEWGPLFHRILQSRIRDWYRRSRVRNTVFGWLRSFSDEDGGEAPDPIQRAEDHHTPGPERSANNDELMQSTMHAVQKLPLRQQQVFLLRAWEGYDVAQTAQAMGISEGSVKTHYSRATRSLRHQLEVYRS
jgi:RNA polymerase sigma-70 factor, ECF subfamily